MEKRTPEPSTGSIHLTKNSKNFFMFFVPPLTEKENFHLPMTTAAKELENLEYPGGTVKKFRMPGIESVHKVDDVFLSYSKEIAIFLNRVFDGQVHLMQDDTPISTSNAVRVDQVEQ